MTFLSLTTSQSLGLTFFVYQLVKSSSERRSSTRVPPAATTLLAVPSNTPLVFFFHPPLARSFASNVVRGMWVDESPVAVSSSTSGRKPRADVTQNYALHGLKKKQEEKARRAPYTNFVTRNTERTEKKV